MKLKKLIKKLQKYNPEAKVEVIVDDQIPCSFELWYGGAPGETKVTKENCKSVDIRIYLMDK